MKSFWKSHKILVLGFGVALLLTSVFITRLVADVVYWPQHQDVEISGWMTVGYVAHSYDVDKRTLVDTIGMSNGPRRHLSLKSIAKARGISLDELRQQLLSAVEIERSAR